MIKLFVKWFKSILLTRKLVRELRKRKGSFKYAAYSISCNKVDPLVCTPIPDICRGALISKIVLNFGTLFTKPSEAAELIGYGVYLNINYYEGALKVWEDEVVYLLDAALVKDVVEATHNSL